jgi:hypothetical protein
MNRARLGSLLILLTFSISAGAEDGIFGVQDQGADIDYHVVELINHSPGHAGVRSILIPGWGQSFNEEKVKGALLFGTTVITLTSSLVFYRKAQNSYDDYKGSGRMDDSHYDDYKRQQTASVVFGGMAAVLWTFSIVDAFSHGYRPVTANASTFQMAMTSDGADLTWRKKF